MAAGFHEFGEVGVGDLDQVAVAEALGIIQHGNDLRRQPEGRHGGGVGPRHHFVFRVAFEQHLGDVVAFALIGDLDGARRNR